MSHRTIVVTGGGRGLGLGLVARFLERGNRVVGTVRDPASAPELAALTPHVVTLDVTSDASIEAAADRLAPLGHVDVLVNNAGINAREVGAARDRRGPLAMARADFLGVMDVNAAGPLLVTQAFLPLLEKAPTPLIVNVSSQLGAMSFGGTHGDDIAYNASKAALNMVTRRTATELAGRGVAVVCVHPGWVRTDMGGPAASLTVEESSAAVADTIEGLTLADSGRFLRWDGTDHDW